MGRKKKPLPLLEGLEITAVAAEGKALGRRRLSAQSERELVIFVPYAAPGDVVNVQVDRKKHAFAEAHIVRFLKKSDMRTEPRCTHFGTCGGCRWQHISYPEQLKFKRQNVIDALQRIGKVEFPEVLPALGSERVYGYRNKMEYTFSNKKWRSWEDVKSGREFTDSPNGLGFHIPGAFDKVLHIDECHLQDNLGNRIRNAVYDFAEAEGISFYDIRQNEGDLRTMMIRIASSGQVMVCVVFGGAEKAVVEKTMEMLRTRFPEITSLLYVVNTKANDTIGDLEVIPYAGPDFIEEEMEGLRFRVNAKSFYQTNSAQAYELYKIARRFAGLDGKPADGKLPVVYDLYTGTGTIANFVARNAGRVIGIEYVPEAIEDARINSQVNGIENTIFYAGDMKDVLDDALIERHGHPDVMIIDPPRAGMHPDVVETIRRARPERIVYVSCNPATQARDLALLDDLYAITAVQPVDMFPHTHHVENVVRLELRAEPKPRQDGQGTPLQV